ncbi:MAG: hypothetical protein H6737_24690 [Alphaproteobacteria bacterium]|nr:hypothetical protein [Alphaproteobacteria bacterium]
MLRLLPLLFAACAHQPLGVHRSRAPIAPTEAIQLAWGVLAAEGGGSVEVCAVQPAVGGYLVDFTGYWVREGVTYRTMRVGIPDGTEPDRTAPFALIAHGDAWYPDAPDAPGFAADLELLGDRAAFEAGRCGG